MSEPGPLLEARGITKTYPGTTALDDVHFALLPGEVHALMGENGAGKSTLIKILTGAETRDSGAILLDRQEVALGNSAAAQKAGVWAVHQEVMVLPNLTVTENLLLGSQPRKFGLIDRRAANGMARETLTELGLDLDVTRPLGSYPLAIRQLVAIARAVHAKARVLVLDEPTASLDAPEVARLFDLVRTLAARGTGIVFITHFLDQVYALSDRITVLRNGKSLGTHDARDLPRSELVSLMIGKELHQAVAAPGHARASSGKTAVRFSELGKKGSVEPFTLDLHEGEAVGAAGLLGSGRTETAFLMFGIDHANTGTIEVDGKTTRIRSPRDAVKQGLAFSPEDRKTDAIFADLSIRDNVVIALQAKRGWLRKLSRRDQQELADRYIGQMNIRTSDAEKSIGKLSGGNQQKVLLGRWLATEPRVLLLDEPTRGIDVGAHAEIVKMIESLRDNGMALYVISSELEELITYSDRISVMQDRRQVQILKGDDLTVDKIVAAIAESATEKAA